MVPTGLWCFCRMHAYVHVLGTTTPHTCMVVVIAFPVQGCPWSSLYGRLRTRQCTAQPKKKQGGHDTDRGIQYQCYDQYESGCNTIGRNLANEYVRC